MRKIPANRKLYASMVTEQRKQRKQREQREDANAHPPTCKKATRQEQREISLLGF